MNRHAHLRLAILLAGLLLLAACGPAATTDPGTTTAEPPTTATPEVSIPLEGTEWTVASLRGGEPVAGSSLTLAFYPDHYMQGTAGCNSFGVDYTASGQGFHLAEIHRTDFDRTGGPRRTASPVACRGWWSWGWLVVRNASDGSWRRLWIARWHYPGF